MRNRNENDNNKNPRFIIAGFLAVIAAYSGLSAVGYAIVSRIFGGAGGLATAALSGLVGTLLFLSILWIFAAVRMRMFKNDPRFDIHNQLLDTLDEISRGNFDVLLTPDIRAPHWDIADAVNKMARDLGDMETMRQDFISNVSHEIRSPLTSIGGFAALLKNDALSADERRHYAEIIEAETKRLSCLSDNLLKLSALDGEKKPLSMRVFRLDRQLQQVALTLEPLWAAKSLNLEADLQKCDCVGDEDLLSQVWVNLLDNAIKFTPDGGNVRIKLTAGDAPVVEVADSGEGISQEDRLRVFERFYKADKSRDRALGGNGLGLSLVKKIVELHGGSVTVKGEVGKGAALTVVLPVCAGSGGTPAATTAKPAPFPRNEPL
jgi:signal transduction histidine kinase